MVQENKGSAANQEYEEMVSGLNFTFRRDVPYKHPPAILRQGKQEGSECDYRSQWCPERIRCPGRLYRLVRSRESEEI